MIVTIIALAITALNCFVYLAPLFDYLSSEYWEARRISKKIADEDLKKSMPNIPDLAASIQNTLAVLIVVLRIFQVSTQYLSGTIVIFSIASIVFFVSFIFKSRNCLRQALQTILGIIIVAIFI